MLVVLSVCRLRYGTSEFTKAEDPRVQFAAIAPFLAAAWLAALNFGSKACAGGKHAIVCALFCRVNLNFKAPNLDFQTWTLEG